MEYLMPWLEVHSTMTRSCSVVELAKLLGISRSAAFGYVSCLWVAALEQQVDGDLSEWKPSFIAQCAGYEGNADLFVDALQRAGILNGRLIARWLIVASSYLLKRYKQKPHLKAAIWAKHGEMYRPAPSRDYGDVDWPKLRMQVFKRDDFTCVYCGQRGGELNADHVVPHSRGGMTLLDNLVTACRECNLEKSDMPVELFLAKKAGRENGVV